MREIKFRAWDTAKKIMYSAGELGKDELCLNPDGRDFVNVSSADQRFSQYMRHIVPLQYTGLKDKNGKEIYEGDIIRGERLHYYNYLKGLQEAIIEWLHCGAWYPFANDDDGMPYPESEECEIIGNIYENPELLEP